MTRILRNEIFFIANSNEVPKFLISEQKKILATLSFFVKFYANTDSDELRHRFIHYRVIIHNRFKSAIQQAISELPCASVSKRVHVQNLSYENEPGGGTAHFHMNGFARRQRKKATRKWPNCNDLRSQPQVVLYSRLWLRFLSEWFTQCEKEF